jgi:hypothetical protein
MGDFKITQLIRLILTIFRYILQAKSAAGGVFVAGALVTWFGGDFAKVGAMMGLIYSVGMVVIWWAPETSTMELQD